MAEEKKNGKMAGTCDCVGCSANDGMRSGYGRHWTFFLLRTLITIIILMFVFWCGVAAGKLSGAYGYDRYGMMRAYPTDVYSGTGGGVAMPMMRINGATSTPSTTGVPQNY